jgi:hypothetical protein
MRKIVVVSFAVASMCLAVAGFARDPIDNGRLQVKPVKNDRYEAAEYILGKAELFGYVGDVKDTKKITGIVLLKGDHASVEQKHIIAITAKAQHIDAFIDLDGKVQPLVDPTPAAGAAPPPLDAQAPVTQSAPATH